MALWPATQEPAGARPLTIVLANSDGLAAHVMLVLLKSTGNIFDPFAIFGVADHGPLGRAAIVGVSRGTEH